MYYFNDLRTERFVTEKSVPCPVKGCSVQVERQKKIFQRHEPYKCHKHDIYISPTTFEYENFESNLLWKSPEDIDLLERIFAEKRESRMARERSEDAVTWNIFRYLEKSGLLKDYLDSISRSGNEDARVIYWSFDQRTGGAWEPLIRAREEFGEKVQLGSEPDLIIETDGSIYFIEAKLDSGNKTRPSKPDDSKGYETGGGSWFREVFKSGVDFNRVANKETFYELMRFWLLGTWIANAQLIRDFYLINLVLNQKERDVEHQFGRHIDYNETRAFKRLTWEQIYSLIERKAPPEGKKEIVEFFHGKTLGYNSSGVLQRAFHI